MAKRLTAAEHRTLAQQHEAFYRHLGGSQSAWPGWAGTALFYTALHEVSAALLDMGEHPVRQHSQRREQIRRCLPNVSRNYEALQDMSESARYGGQVPIQAKLAANELGLQTIRAEIQRLSSSSSTA